MFEKYDKNKDLSKINENKLIRVYVKKSVKL